MPTKVCRKCKKKKKENARYFKYISKGNYREVCKECESKKVKKNRFLVIKHLRTDNAGCITAACLVEPSVGHMTIGFSFCSPRDEFCKKKGRKIALERMNSNEDTDIINFKTPIAKKVFAYIKFLAYANYTELPNWVDRFIKAYEKKIEEKLEPPKAV